MTTTDPGIDKLYAAWREAMMRRDLEAVLDLLTPDYVLWTPGAAPLGRDALRPALIAALDKYDVEPTFERDEQIVVGDLAFERGWDVQEARPRAGGQPRVQRQRVFLILRRDAKGVWRFARGMSQPGPA
jgi:uncharacterized protein (TIGR02246 family)